MQNQLRTLIVALFISGAIVCLITSAYAQKPGYHLLNKIEVGGDGGWDALIADSKAHRLYVSHGTKVVVIDISTDKVVGEIPNTNGVHGIAFDEKRGRGFTSNGRDNTVTIFDLKTLKTIDTVKTGQNPDAILFDPASNSVFVFNGRSNDATVINSANGKVTGTIALGGKPEFAASNETGVVYVNIEDKSEVVAIDSKNRTVTNHWTIAPTGTEPTGLAIDAKTHRLFIASGNKKMVVMDSDTGKVLTSLSTGDGTDGMEFDPQTKLAFSPNGEGTLTVVHEDSKDKFSVAENVPTQPRARTMAIDTATHKVYLPTAQFGPTPAATAAQPRPRPSMLPNTFVILVFGK